MEVRAVSKNAHIAPQKCRLVADQIRDKRVSEGLDILRFSNKKAAAVVRKILESAAANAENNHSADVDDLTIRIITIDQGRSSVRYRARARGRGASITKRTSHITITLSDGHTEEEHS